MRRRSASTGARRLRAAAADARRRRTAAGSRMRAGRAARGVRAGGRSRRRGWSWRERLALLASRRAGGGPAFAAMPGETVADLRRGLPRRGAARTLIEPLCVAALNTPADEASGAVFLRVLRDAPVRQAPAPPTCCCRASASARSSRTGRSPGSQAHGATIRLGHRVDADRARRRRLARRRRAASTQSSRRQRGRGGAARRAARRRLGGDGRRVALRADRHRLRCAAPAARLPEPMLALRADDATRPAQFVFDRGRLGGAAGPARLRDQRRRGLGRARHRSDARRRRWRRRTRARPLPARAARDRADDRREARDLRLHARPGAAADGDRARPVRLRRLRRRPLSGDARRRGAQRRRRGARRDRSIGREFRHEGSA